MLFLHFRHVEVVGEVVRRHHRLEVRAEVLAEVEEEEEGRT